MTYFKKIIGILLSIGMIMLGVWLGYQGIYYRIAGTSATATVVESRNSTNSADDLYYTFQDASGMLQFGEDRVIGLEVPAIGDSIQIYYLKDGRSTYVTPIDDYILPLLAIGFGALALKGSFMLESNRGAVN
ncbi:MAG: hypothetical protein A3A33_02340 [Candidatus Yanofskybacteria bacterium RIFCSPLOWO2_01_FULL_49_25]|uniref:DUF3592 domain-containing protein n=1 Tax=Candidatus Yanofskybacteria bacterium RIFCSPLOWO2_01_FULL_49_25 TaxID=1802701 RepID=A0A1F8GSB3_9BACT|nr:MAG: hypothetical protein A3A33_02340 [Candidatus Yanofskybacteria bacterium RIFCSPLOWO2_01_FULL_49_25]